MDFDHIAENKNEQKVTIWLKLWSSRSPEILSIQLAKKHRLVNLHLHTIHVAFMKLQYPDLA